MVVVDVVVADGDREFRRKRNGYGLGFPRQRRYGLSLSFFLSFVFILVGWSWKGENCVKVVGAVVVIVWFTPYRTRSMAAQGLLYGFILHFSFYNSDHISSTVIRIVITLLNSHAQGQGFSLIHGIPSLCISTASWNR